MTTNSIYFTDQERAWWLEECVAIVREATLARRASTCRSMPDAIGQAALDLGIPKARAHALFYRMPFFVSREQWLSLKMAAVRECDARARQLQERMDFARARRLQHQIELEKAECIGSSGTFGPASATGDGIDV